MLLPSESYIPFIFVSLSLLMSIRAQFPIPNSILVSPDSYCLDQFV